MAMTNDRPAAAAATGQTGGRHGDFDAVVVGAGFAGLYMLAKLRELGFSAIVIEQGADVGGTWYWNRYPGARCDVESINYQYAFSEDLYRAWTWSERYAAQPEILRYFHFVADRLNLWPDIQLETTVTGATWDPGTGRWVVDTDRGDRYTGRFCITAVGCLSVPKLPELAGLDDFAGPAHHTARWPEAGLDLTGLRVAVIGTGASGIQFITNVASQVQSLTAFQRTANYSVPAHNRPLTPEQVADFKNRMPELRRDLEQLGGALDRGPHLKRTFEVDEKERERRYEEVWAKGGLGMMAAFRDLLTDKAANDTAADFVRRKIRAKIPDPALADALIPTDHPFAAKRPCVDVGYYEIYGRANVSLVDLRRSPIDRVIPSGIRMADGTELDFDVLVFATGFDALTGALLAMDIRGTGGRTLLEEWRDGPVSYLGLAVSGFPNLLTITGPGSPSVLSNVVVSIEQHVEWIGDLLAFMRKRGASCVEAQSDAQRRWVEHVVETAGQTLYSEARSWYWGANVPGKPQVFMPYVAGVGPYRQICDEVARKGYEGFAFGSIGRAE
jgi:cyclohexanone monooxygenase